MRSGDYEQAVRVINDVLVKNPNNTQAHYLKGVALVSQRHYQDAAHEYNQVIRLAPNDPLSGLARDGLRKIAH
jgi:Flp pilus assembly protein TadD